VRLLRAQDYIGYIVGLSGTEGSCPEFEDVGVNAVIEKPLDIDRLQKTLEGLGLPFVPAIEN
jgi:hypothetical protein